MKAFALLFACLLATCGGEHLYLTKIQLGATQDARNETYTEDLSFDFGLRK